MFSSYYCLIIMLPFSLYISMKYLTEMPPVRSPAKKEKEMKVRRRYLEGAWMLLSCLPTWILNTLVVLGLLGTLSRFSFAATLEDLWLLGCVFGLRPENEVSPSSLWFSRSSVPEESIMMEGFLSLCSALIGSRLETATNKRSLLRKCSLIRSCLGGYRGKTSN